MRSRIPFVAVYPLAAILVFCGQASAIDRFWQGDVSNNYGGAAAAAGNWNTLGGTGTLTSPRASQNERAVIGTDDPAGAVNCLNAPFGCPVISSNVAAPGGIALGLRVIDYDDLNQNGQAGDFLYDNFDPQNPTVVVPPFFNLNTLVGKLTITGGNVSPVTTPASGIGADGRVLVGVHGRGYLTMTGGTLTLNNTALIVGGVNVTTDAGTPQELGPSTVDLSGNATVNLTGGTSAIANFDRRLKVTGPNVVFNSTGRIRFVGTSLYTAEITSATDHSILNTANNALLAGSVAVQFSGAGAARDPVASLGETWTLVKSTLGSNAIDGNFSNLGPGGVITPTGLDAAHAAPLGANYRIKKVAVGNTSELQLSYEQTLVLTVNRDTGQVSIRNPLAGQIAIDSYSISSARGSLLASYAGLGSSTPGAGQWVKPGPPGANTANVLTEVQNPTTNPPPYNLFSVPSVSLGTGFSRTAVGTNIANFGFDGEDLIFEFSGPNTGGILRGQIEYVGTKFENDLVLRVNPNTGQAFIKNDSLTTLKIDGFSILSSTGNLNGAGFTGLGGAWQTSSPITANAITQTNLTGFTTLAPGAQLAIGDISSLNFTTAEAQAGLSIQYILAEGLTGASAVGGDYNGNGIVDAADYTVWRNNLNASLTLTNENPAATTPGVVDQEDYDYWKAQFGLSSTPAPETTFRVGSVVFDTTAGAGAVASAAVPEPTTACVVVGAVGWIASFQRRRRISCSSAPAESAEIQQRGVSTMNRHTKFTWMALLLGFLAALHQVAPAQAVTQGIALTNGDFSLPGPIGTKTVAFDETGTPFAPSAPIVTLSTGERAGGTPGWTFTGGSGIAASGETNVGKGNSTFGGNSPGDSGTEGGGNPGNELLLSTLDGRVYQSSSFNVVSIPATQKYKLSFDAHNIFTPNNGTCHLQARLYYVDAGSNRQTIGSPLVINNLAGFQKYTIEFVGGNAALTPALGRPIGVEFDTVSREFDPVVTESWAGVDNVILQITGTIFGDLNGDGLVNTTDYTTLRDNLQEAQTFEFEGELTGDYKVDLNDFRAFKTAYDAANGAGSFAAMVAATNVPEPTSLGLLVTLASLLALISSRRRHCLGRMQCLILSALAFIAVLATASQSQATQFAYDPFLIGTSPAAGQYTVGTLQGQNPTIGPANPSFFRDGWTLGSDGQVVVETSLSYLGAVSPGGSVNGFGRTERYLNNTNNPLADWDDGTTGTFYMSFVVNFGQIAPGGNMGYRAVEFFPVGVVPGENRIGDIGYNEYFSSFGAAQQNAPTAKMQFNLYGQQIIDSAPDNYIEDGANHLLVLKWSFTTENNGDSISLFLDPTSLDEPVVPSAVVTGINAQLGAIGAASFGSGIAGTTTTLDDIRVGDTFADVMPELPKPGDTNGDDIIDLADYNNIIQYMNLSGAAVPSTPTLHPDVTGDGRVTIADYRLWKDKREVFGSGSAAVAGVPEPSSFVLLLAATALGIFHRRR